MESEVPTLEGNISLLEETPSRSRSQRSAATLETTVGDFNIENGIHRAAGDPSKVGRHEILGRLGTGGMGVVYTAYDPELDRRLAIKVIRPQSGTGGGARRSHGRLMREAQAMARVSHPNVITVFDVGTIDDRVYIAMELIDGSTLNDWCSREGDSDRPHHRPWREIIEVYLQAAEGLIAAHQAGLVHRDFKPHNVLVDRDGGARVLDFGLARAANSPAPKAEIGSTQGDAPSVNNQLDSKLTRTGAMIGTPAYMSPEQIEGRPADARSDQFSFCVSLWEALYDARPFAGKSLAELSYSVSEGAIQAPPAERAREVPNHIRLALERGLSRRKTDRFENIRALANALALDPRSRRRRSATIVLAVASLMLFGAAITYAATRSDPAQACRAGARDISESWGPSHASALDLAFDASGLPFARRSANSARERVDEYLRDWRKGFASACDATHEDNSQSAETLDLRMSCLANARSKLEATLELLTTGDAPLIAASDDVLARLPDLHDCANLDGLRAAVAAPTDPQLKLALAQARVRLAELSAQRVAGALASATEGLALLQRDELVVQYPPFAAELSAERGILALMMGDYASSERLLKEAYWQATEHSHDTLAASCASWLVSVVGTARARADDGLDWWHNARSAYVRIGTEPPPELLRRHAELLRGRGKYAEAREELITQLGSDVKLSAAEAIASGELLSRIEVTLANYQGARERLAELHRIVSAEFGEGHPKLATLWHAEAELAIAEGKWERARTGLERAMRIEQTIFGSAHPSLAWTHSRLSVLHRQQEHTELARKEARIALQIAEETLGLEHPLTGSMAHTLGLALIAERDLPAAHAMMERARVIAARVYGEQSVEIAQSLQGLGTIAELRKEYEAAEEFYQRALSIHERELGRDHPRSADLHSQLGNLDFWRHDYDAAADHYFRTLEIREQTLGSDHPLVPIAIMHAAGSYDYTGDLKRAGELHARALESFRLVYGPDHHYVATAALNLSRLRERQGRFEESLALTQEAKRVWERDHDPDHFEMAYVYTLLGRAFVGLGRHQDAIEPLEHALSIREAAGAELVQRETVLADTRFALGRALWATRRSRAKGLIAAAKRGYDQAGPYAEYERGELKRWADTH